MFGSRKRGLTCLLLLLTAPFSIGASCECENLGTQVQTFTDDRDRRDSGVPACDAECARYLEVPGPDVVSCTATEVDTGAVKYMFVVKDTCEG